MERNDALWRTLPKDARSNLTAPWSTFEPFYFELKQRELNAAGIESWMLDWSKLLELLREIEQRLSVQKDLDTTNKAAERAFLSFQEQIGIPSEREDQALRERLLQSGLQPKGYELPLVRLKIEAENYREENLALAVQEEEFSIEYSRITGTQTVTWEGHEVTITNIEQEFLNPVRPIREKAWKLCAERQLRDVPALCENWKKLLTIRRTMAKNAGHPDYRSYQWKAMTRMDYTPADCIEFADAILKTVVPMATTIYEARKRDLGLDVLKPWDLMDGWYSRPVDPPGTYPLKPFTTGSELAEKSRTIFTALDPELGKNFETMIDEQLLDLENRKGKSPGAYCTSFEVVRRPYILMNAVGTHEDVQTMLHEAGHAFHEFACAHLPHPGQRAAPMEFAEVASMGMELLAAPFLERTRGGFYDDTDAARARLEHLERSILFWPFMAVVDTFQHWVYENPDAAFEGANCSAEWDRLWTKFIPAVDYSGHEEYRATGWQRKQHIFKAPFYYVEYGLAQLGAQQVWQRSLKDKEKALNDYRSALALGGTVPLPKLFELAGGKLGFDVGTVRETVEATIHEVARLRAAV